jgi:hypothetical protein
MKFPKHIILDVAKTAISNASQYWIFKYIFSEKKNINMLGSLTFHRNFYTRKERWILNKITLKQKKFTVRHSHTIPILFLTEEEIRFALNFFVPRPKVKNRLLDSLHYGKEVYDFFKTKRRTDLFDKRAFRLLIKSFTYSTKFSKRRAVNLWNLFDINFLKKERIYTKLKYSRVPQYDIVSGGAAALFAGFLGFLICEKFGFELLDSGDFYYLFMYAVFFFFFMRIYLKLINSSRSHWNVFSIKWFFLFFKTSFVLAAKTIKFFFKL